LERKGYRALVAADGYEALALLKKQRVDLILLDVMMPGLSGLDVLRELRAQHPPTELPIIMVSAKGESGDIVEALELGADDYVTKPIDFPVVVARVEAHLRLRQAFKPLEQSARPAAAAPLAEIRPSMILAGKYLLESKIGEGGFGVVYRATQRDLDRKVAVKILQTSMLADAESSGALARFRQEGISACRINHPNAVAVLDFGIAESGVAYLVMELLEGGSLSDELRRHGALTLSRAAKILLPVCAVLSQAHAAGVIHRDIKPANIFLHRGRSGEIVKVLDFGIAKLMGDHQSTLTLEGRLLGTPTYMAPERLSNQPYDGRADVYSLGVTLYEMLAGHPPFKARDPMAVALQQVSAQPPPLREVAAVPPAVDQLVMEALDKDPGRRPTLADLADRFARAVAAVSGGPSALPVGDAPGGSGVLSEIP
jgi:serine/threonine protein kinase/CheY-like chemotaxis protein